MYTVVMGAGTDPDRALTKARAVVDLPGRTDDRTVIVVHASDAGEVDPTVDRTVKLLAEHGIETEVETVAADPPAALVETAADRDADLVCVGGRRHSPAGKVQLRGGAQSVILNTDRPVLVAGEPPDTE